MDLLTGEEEQTSDGLHDGVGVPAAAGAQVDAGDKEGDQQRHDPEGEQSLARLDPVCKERMKGL